MKADGHTPSTTASDLGSFREATPWARALAVALFLSAALFASTGMASAAVTHTFKSSFAVTQPAYLAVDQAQNYVYVTAPNPTTAAVFKFDVNGLPVNFSALGSNKIDGCCAGDLDITGRSTFGLGGASIRQIAVDNTPGLTQGAIMVTNNADVFLPSGAYLASVTGTSSTNPGQTGGENCGSTVDPNGAFYVGHRSASGDLFSEPVSGFTDKFSPGPQDSPSSWVPRSTLFTEPEGRCTIAVSSTGALYQTGPAYTSSAPLLKYEPTVFDSVVLDPFNETYCGCRAPSGKLIDPSVRGVAIDEATDEVYANRGGEVARYTADGELVEIFAEGLASGSGVAVDSSSGTVYVADHGANSVRIYESQITPDIDDVTADPGQTAAEIQATVAPAGQPTVTACEVQYGLTSAYGASVPCNPGTPYGDSTAVDATLPGLTPETVYHYRVVATNANGTHWEIDRVLRTQAVVDLSTDSASSVTRTTATLNGSFEGTGMATDFYFEWGETAAFGNSTAIRPAGDGVGPTAVSTDIEGLEAYTATSGTYHYRVVATNTLGTTYGQDRTFSTEAPMPPTVSDTDVASIGTGAATLRAVLNPNSADTSFRFEYGTGAGYDSQTIESPSIGADEADHQVAADIGGLSPGTTYHYRVVAMNFGGTTYGPDRTFATPSAPAIAGVAVHDVTRTDAKVSVEARAGFRATTVAIELGETVRYDAGGVPVGSLAAENVLRRSTVALTGLRPGTTYHLRAVAENEVGTVRSGDLTFVTEPAATTLAPPPPVRCRKGLVRRGQKCVRKKKKQSKGRAKGKEKKRTIRTGGQR